MAVECDLWNFILYKLQIWLWIPFCPELKVTKSALVYTIELNINHPIPYTEQVHATWFLPLSMKLRYASPYIKNSWEGLAIVLTITLTTSWSRKHVMQQQIELLLIEILKVTNCSVVWLDSSQYFVCCQIHRATYLLPERWHQWLAVTQSVMILFDLFICVWQLYVHLIRGN